MKLQKTSGAALFVSLTLALPAVLPRPEPPAKGPSSSSKASGAALDPADLDKTVDPCQDFFRYSCGTWLKANPIPAEYPSWGRFNELQERNREVLHGILEKAAAKPGADFAERAIGDFYASCMDEARAEKDGLSPVQPLLDRVAALETPADAVVEAGRLRSEGVPALFPIESTQDARDATEVTAEVDQGGLGLPDRDYYTKEDDKSKTLAVPVRRPPREALRPRGQRRDLGRGRGPPCPRVRDEARGVDADEGREARPRAPLQPQEARRAEGARARVPWAGVFTAAGAPAFESLNVVAPGYFKALSEAVKSESLDDWKTLPPRRRPAVEREVPDRRVRERGLRLQRRASHGHESAPAPLEAVRGLDGRKPP